MQNLLLVIDGNSLMYRAFYALPNLNNKEGLATNAVFGFMNMFFKLLADHAPQYAAIAFDMHGPTFRHIEYEQYKATRQETPEGLQHQFSMLKELLRVLPIAIYQHEGYEADDVMSWLATAATESGFKTLLVTGDKDALQLISPDVNVLLTRKGISSVQNYNMEVLKYEYGLEPWQIIELKALMGDSSDNIPGVPGIGEKTALTLIRQYSSLTGVYDHIDEIRGSKLRDNLINYRESAILSRKLATIIKKSPIVINLENCKIALKYTPELIEKLDWLGFNSMISRMPIDGKFEITTKSNKTARGYAEINDTDVLSHVACALISKGRVFLHFSDCITMTGEGLPVYKISLPNKLAFDSLKRMLESEYVEKITYDAKSMLHKCRKNNVKIKGIKFDLLIAAYLLEPSRSKYELKQLASDYLKSDADFPDAEDVKAMFNIMSKKLKDEGMSDLYQNIENPLIEVLFAMEDAGFNIDKKMLVSLGIEFNNTIEKLTNEIYKITQTKFNINSTKQLSDLLFDKLRLPIIKKTKTGYSTDIEVLEQLAGLHPIISDIIEYRQISKLKSTYVDGLLKLIEPSDGRVRTTFNQTTAVTGRISSIDPNLQNIPVRMEMGKRIRKVFIPSAEHVLVDADYSQIELRVLAHMSEDPAFITSFLSGEDIHLKTAAYIFGKKIDEVTNEQRNSAKAVNFGIIYGISDFGLAQNLGIPVGMAKEFINNYFTKYPRIKSFLDSLVDYAEKYGYVQTLLGRKREIPEIHSKNNTMHMLGKRLAMNTPIQGTAADIIKKAMIDVYNELINRNLRSKLILQVHDELIIDTHIDEVDEIKNLLQDKMSNAIKLLVPLQVDVGIGETWYDAK